MNDISLPMPPAFELAIQASFGSVAAWLDDFLSCAAQAGGPAQLLFNAADGRLLNRATAQAGVPILALDQPWRTPDEAHAGLACIDWAAAYARYQAAVLQTGEDLLVQGADTDHARMLDVRRAGVFAQAPTMAAGARWMDPARVDEWARQLPADARVVVYCVHGHEVSRVTALRLRAAGVSAGFLAGGLAQWQADGRPVMARSAP